ncbi:purine catabolism regulator [Haloactinospora alba]|uniref:Purine catabolism regulator n=1 Tax=Haloactinospora alba TaxID=405555 RepID=A0A543N9E3_9ACTN|nr:PucR family transcriptional regulator [Haloactinospora alba]TQN28455.1 purine catabolism regulator [Haloactinospora alba]
MRPTMRWLARRDELRVRPLVESDTPRPIRWVHVSELDDPAPFLSGGELLLTTGLNAPDTAAHWHPYIERLATRGVAGVGFGVGFDHAEVPTGLVDAARHHDLPLVLVPRDTPFIAISETVAATIAYDQEDALSSAVDAQRELVTAGSSPGGPRPVTDRLAAALSCRVLVFDGHGRVRYASPDSAHRYAARIRAELEELPPDTPAHSASLTVAGEHVSVLPLDAGGADGYLAAARADGLSQAERSVLATAAGVLALDLAGERETREARRRERSAVLRLALSGDARPAEDNAAALDVVLPGEPLRVALLNAPAERAEHLLRTAEEQRALNQAGALVAPYGDATVAVLVTAAEGDLQALEEVLHLVPRSRAVASEPVAFGELPDALRRVRSVQAGSRESPERLLLARDVATAGLLTHLDTPAVRGWAETLLEPLERYANRSRVDLSGTLRVFLQHNGHIDGSSTALGIHRHTMRHRLDRITELLETSLEDPTARAELWLALRVRELS